MRASTAVYETAGIASSLTWLLYVRYDTVLKLKSVLPRLAHRPDSTARSRLRHGDGLKLSSVTWLGRPANGDGDFSRESR